MEYLLVITNAPDAWDAPQTGVANGVFDDWTAYTVALRDAGVLVTGSGLHAPDVATTVRVRDGERLLTDGPFSETKEHIIGFYVIDAPDLDVALDWAARVPNARSGGIEVRPLRPELTVAATLRDAAQSGERSAGCSLAGGGGRDRRDPRPPARRRPRARRRCCPRRVHQRGRQLAGGRSSRTARRLADCRRVAARARRAAPQAPPRARCGGRRRCGRRFEPPPGRTGSPCHPWSGWSNTRRGRQCTASHRRRCSC